MVRTSFSGRTIVSVLLRFTYRPVSREGSHVRLRYEDPNTGEVRFADVPMHDEIAVGTLRDIADQCGADEFHDWCRWIDAQS